MVGKLLALDLKDKGIIVSIVHPGFMRTEMTKGVGFDKYWDVGGAVSSEVAAESLRVWVEGLGIERSGEYWAPRGASEFFSFSFIFLFRWLVVGASWGVLEWKG